MTSAPPRRDYGRDLSEHLGTSPWHAEDLRVGDYMDLGTVSVSRAEIIAFATQFDPLPIHLDDTNPVFGSVIASGVHTMALFSSLASRIFLPRLALVAGKGIEQLRLPAPVLPESTLTGTIDIVGSTMSDRRADVSYRAVLLDGRDHVVLSFIGIAVVARRSVGG